MKRYFLMLMTFCLAASAQQRQTTASETSLNGLEQGFQHIPDTVQTSVYWYWISDNISKAGVVKDLEAMKKVGINRAFIGNIGTSDVSYGKVKLFSDEWWDITHTALKTATRLGIEIGIFNSPGWSQSGGPWVKPSQAMRYLTSSETKIAGPMLFNEVLVKPAGDFQDVKVIAYKVPKGFSGTVLSGVITTTANDPVLDLTSATDYTVRSVTIWPGIQPVRANATLQVEKEGTYQTIKEFIIDRHNTALNVGFKPNGPVAVSIPATIGKKFRLLFTNGGAGLAQAKIALSSSPVVESYVEKTLGKMFQDPLPYWNEYQWPVQPVVNDAALVIDPATVIDITSFMAKDGTLNWKVPAGNWVIQRSGMLPTGVTNAPAAPEGTGLETDKMSKEHIRSHFEAFLGEIIKRIPAEDRKTWKMVVQDSYETGGQNWTDGMQEKFKARYHYDPLAYLPVLEGKVVGSEDKSDRFLWDLRRFIADKVAYDYVGGLREVSHEHGLKTWLESYGHWGFPGEFLQYGGQSDEIGGEFWSEGELGNIENRAASSAAHIYGKTKVSAESFTAGGKTFGRFPYEMKQRGDRFFTEGINNTLLHLFIQQPDERTPGINAWFGNEFNRHNTWFSYMDLFIAYLKRCNFMLQQGKYAADVAYFIGEDAPKMTGITDPALPKGYSFDYINAEVLMTRTKIVNGKMVLPDGMTYSLLVLPPLKTMRPELLAKLSELIKQGLHVVGPLPERSPSMEGYPAADDKVLAMTKALSNSPNILKDKELQITLTKLSLKPDFESKDESVLFIHRTLPDAEIYFVSNQKEEKIAIEPVFRVDGLQPQVWNPVTGEMRTLSRMTRVDGRTSVPLKLEPLQSLFIVFAKAGSAGNVPASPSMDNFPEPVAAISISTPWTVVFDAGLRGPAQPVAFKELTDWTTNVDDAIKYYSGTAIYENMFKTEKNGTNEKLFLTIGKLSGIAKVKVNGVDVGGIWTAPWKVDITAAVKAGENKVEIAVVNNWMNRLIGDSKLPEAERKTFATVNPYDAKSPLQASGLTGVVQIEKIKY